jgi:undecaprenyl-diphosphatase
LVKWSVGRGRPISNGVLNTHPFQIHPFNGGLAGLFIAKPGQSFPSGHASLAFAIATVLAFYFPRGRLILFGAAGLVAVERVLEGAHYLSDVVAGSGIGIIAACCATRVCQHHFAALYSRKSIND